MAVCNCCRWKSLELAPNMFLLILRGGRGSWEFHSRSVSGFELTPLARSLLPFTGSLRPLWHSPRRRWQTLPRRLASRQQVHRSPCQPALERWSTASCNWLHLLVFASMRQKLLTPRKARIGSWNQGPLIKPEIWKHHLRLVTETGLSLPEHLLLPTSNIPSLRSAVTEVCLGSRTQMHYFLVRFSFHHYMLLLCGAREPRGCAFRSTWTRGLRQKWPLCHPCRHAPL